VKPIQIPFNKPVFLGAEHQQALLEAVERGHLSGLGSFSKQVEGWLDQCNKSTNLLVTSATHALEMMALLMDFKAGDEVIVPSFTFVSSINAFLLRGARPVFADIDAFGNLDLEKIPELIGPRTRAIVVVHYAGNSTRMDKLLEIAAAHKLAVLEDAAQALGATYQGKALGTFGALGCYSFHETKNVGSGEGGALIVNDKSHLEYAESSREKGTNRKMFSQGLVDKYTWVSLGSSYVLSDLNASYLWPQLKIFDQIQARRKSQWNLYQNELSAAAAKAGVDILGIPSWNGPNYHLFALLLKNMEERNAFISFMREEGILCPFHYVPLHRSPMGKKLDSVESSKKLPMTDRFGDCLVRLPLFYNMTESEQARVLARSLDFLGKKL
jgi:dTDP-4-amino-4,6-dideoxygalactose transaminase